MMARMLTQVPLPLLPGDAAEIAPGVGMVTGPDGSGVMWVHGLATFAWDAGDEAGRRLAAVQLWKLKAATQAQVAEAFGVIPVSVWRWEKALAAGGVAGLVPDRKGPRRPSRLTPAVVARIRELDRQGLGKAGIAAAAGVSESSVRSVLRPAGAGGGDVPGAGAGPAADPAAGEQAETAGGPPGTLPVLPDPVARDGERVLARFGLLGEGAVPVFTPGARYPLAGLLLALPALAGTGLLECARATYGRLRNGFYGLEVMLVVLVFLALLREPRAEGATRVSPAALGRVLGLDRAPEVKTIRPSLGQLAAAARVRPAHHGAGPPSRRRPACRARVPSRRRARPRPLRHPAGAEDACGPAEIPRPGHRGDRTYDAAGDPVFMVIAEPSQSLAGQLRGLLPQLRQVVGEGRRVTVCFDRGGWSPALFADITGAGFDLLTYRKGPAADLPGPAFTTVTCTDDRGRPHQYELADTTIALEIGEGPRKGEQVTLRQVTRREPASGGGTRQIHVLTSGTDLAAGQVCWRMSSRWREENYFRYARTRFALDALDSYAAAPDDPDRMVPNPARKTPASAVRQAEAAPGPGRRDGPGRPHSSPAAQPRPRPGRPTHQPGDQRPGRPP